MKHKCSILNTIFLSNKWNQWSLVTATFFLLLASLTSCEKNFDINVQANQPLLVVEAYINNEMPAYNYVILNRSLDYLSLDFQSTPVTDAIVTITEGEHANEGYLWD